MMTLSATLSDEQRQLAESVTALADDHRGRPERIGAQRADAVAATTTRELGLVTMRWPEEAGGAGLAGIDAVLVATALGRGPAVVPFAGPVIAAELLLRAGLTEGDLARKPTTVAIDPATLDLGAGDEVIAFDAAGAERAIGLAGDGTSVVAGSIDTGDELPAADLTRVTRTVGSGETVGEIDAEPLTRWRAFALTVLSADLVGTIDGALALAVDYAADRRQFGTPIGAFQAIAHLLADAHVQLEGARSAVAHAAQAVDGSDAEAALLAARVAKAYAARVAPGVCEAAVQVHGGIGTTWESRCHVFLRRALTGAALLGGEDAQLDAIATTRLGAP